MVTRAVTMVTRTVTIVARTVTMVTRTVTMVTRTVTMVTIAVTMATDVLFWDTQFCSVRKTRHIIRDGRHKWPCEECSCDYGKRTSLQHCLFQDVKVARVFSPNSSVWLCLLQDKDLVNSQDMCEVVTKFSDQLPQLISHRGRDGHRPSLTTYTSTTQGTNQDIGVLTLLPYWT